MLLLWIIVLICIQLNQSANHTCLRANPGLLDAGLGFYIGQDSKFESKKENDREEDDENFAKFAVWFAQRFKVAHVLAGLDTDWINFIGAGVRRYENASDTKFPMIVQTKKENLTNDMQEAVRILKEYKDTGLKINEGGNGTVVGLYLQFIVKSYELQLQAVENVFGPRNNSNFPVGHLFPDCYKQFNYNNGLKYLKRLQFITCGVRYKGNFTPEESADKVVSYCNQLRKTAKSLNITAKIRCLVRYISNDMPNEGVVESVSGFQKFWCRIIERRIKKRIRARIIMWSAFDEIPDKVSGNQNKDSANETMYNTGWWRRKHPASDQSTAFAELAKEFPAIKFVRNCTGSCQLCSSSAECCSRNCNFDSSFQPLERGQRPPQVCRSKRTTCSVRTPKKPTSVPSSNIHWSTNSLTTISLSILCVTLIFAGAVALFVYLKAKSNKVFNDEELQHFFEGSTSLELTKNKFPLENQNAIDDLPYDRSLEISKSDFQIYEEKLGTGEYGIVLKGCIGEENVAVKTTKPGVHKSYIKALQSELKALMYLGHHENIVNLVGAHTSMLASGKLYLFLDLCALGNLLEFLRSHRKNFCKGTAANDISKEYEERLMTGKDLLQWSLQIASAMEHLAKKMVVHGDIAARNILVFSWDLVKLTDFGLSRRLYEYATHVKTSQEPLPWRHMSIESLRDLSFSMQSDVWSFGITLWEMFSLGEVPYPGHSCSQDFLKQLLDGLRPVCPLQTHPLIYEAMFSCWVADAKARPSITTLHFKLTTALDALYSNPLYISFSEV